MNVGEFSDAYDEAVGLAYNDQPVMAIGPKGQLWSIKGVNLESHTAGMQGEYDLGNTLWIEIEEY